MPKVSIDQEQFSKVLSESADFVKAAAPQLEKYRDMQSTFEKVAEQIGQKLVENDLVAAEDQNALVEQIKEGGIAKLAEAFDHAIRSTRQAAQVMGKAAESNSTGQAKTSDEIWSEGFGLNS